MLGIDLREPLCAQVFPGCEIDASAYEAFITNNEIEKGILVTDKGFPPSKIKKILETHRTLHYLTPIKCNDKRILEYDMLSFEGVLLNIDKNVRYKKCQVSENLFLYSFQDGSRATGQFVTIQTPGSHLPKQRQRMTGVRKRLPGVATGFPPAA